MRTLIITEIPSTYRVDFFNELAQSYGDQLRIAFVPTGLDPEKELIHEKNNQPFWSISTYYGQTNKRAQNLALWKDILSWRPKVIISTGFPPKTLPLALFAKISGAKLYTWFAGTHWSEKQRGPVRVVFRKFISKFLSGAVLYSDFSQAYLRSLNPELVDTLVLGNNTRNAATYAKKIEQHKPAQESEIPTIITVGFQTERKNSILLLSAFCDLIQQGHKAKLIIVGEGNQLDGLRAAVTEAAKPWVTFTGGVAPAEVLKLYAKSDIYVHPSLSDQWPQTYNEAAAAGLAVLISDRSGVWDEYIDVNDKLVLFDPENQTELKNKLQHVLENPQTLQTLKKAAQHSALNNDMTQCMKRWSAYFELKG